MTFDYFLIFLVGLFLGTGLGIFLMCVVISGRAEYRKALMIFLDGCNHKETRPDLTCRVCGRYVYGYRSFPTPDDMIAVKRKLVEKGEWQPFCKHCEISWARHHRYVDFDVAIFTDWLLDESRFCQLAADYLRREK